MTTTLNPTHYGMGFFEEAERTLPSYALVEAVRQLVLNQEIKEDTPRAMIETLLVSKSLKELTYHDFLKIAPSLFYYERHQMKPLEVNLLEPSRAIYEQIKSEAEHYFDTSIKKGIRNGNS